MTYEKRKILEKYLPENALNEIIHLQEKYNFKLVISRTRKSKLGDFRPVNRQVSIISVNGDLIDSEFLIVLLHEIAHLLTWLKYKRRKKPHGPEWKEEFHNLVKHFIDLGSFHENIAEAILSCMKKKTLSTIKCEKLARALNANNIADNVFLRDIPDNTEFLLKQGKRFIKLHRIKTRYKCKEVETGRIYTIHPMAEVQWYKVV